MDDILRHSWDWWAADEAALKIMLQSIIFHTYFLSAGHKVYGNNFSFWTAVTYSTKNDKNAELQYSLATWVQGPPRCLWPSYPDTCTNQAQLTSFNYKKWKSGIRSWRASEPLGCSPTLGLGIWARKDHHQVRRTLFSCFFLRFCLFVYSSAVFFPDDNRQRQWKKRNGPILFVVPI